MTKIRRMFPGGNTSQGFYSLHNNIIGKNRNRLYILKGMPGGGKSSLMKEIGKRALDEGFTLEYHHCPSEPDSIDGLVIDELGIGIVDGTPPHSMDPAYPGLGDKIVNLATYVSESKMEGYKGEIAKAKRDNKKAYRKAFNYFRAAKFIYDEIVKAHGEYVDFEKVNRMNIKYIDEIFSKNIVNRGKYQFRNRHMFSSAYTPKGYFDYTETIINGIGNKYYLSGSLGTGKSTFIKRVRDMANIWDFHLEIYYNSYAPDKIESLLIYELDLIISSNEKIKDGNHKTIDFDQYFNESKADNGDHIVFEELMNKGIRGLNMAARNHSIQEKIYNDAINFEGIDEERESIWKEIQNYI